MACGEVTEIFLCGLWQKKALPLCFARWMSSNTKKSSLTGSLLSVLTIHPFEDDLLESSEPPSSMFDCTFCMSFGSWVKEGVDVDLPSRE